MHLSNAIESTPLYSRRFVEGASHNILGSPQQSPCLGTLPPAKDVPNLIDPDLPILNMERERLAAISRIREDSRTHRAVSPQVTAVSKKSFAPASLKPLAAPPRLVQSKSVPAFVPIRQLKSKTTNYRGLVALRKAAQCIEQEMLQQMK